jgi:hypothetical protein
LTNIPLYATRDEALSDHVAVEGVVHEKGC